MARSARSGFLVLLVLGAWCGPAGAQPAPEAASPPASRPGPACEAAGTAAEDRHGIPSGLLNAIGRIESGKRDPATGRLAAWPWAINAEGRGRLFDTRNEAEAAVRALQDAGVFSIDVGCFQVNLVHHRGAFPTPADGFDPARNADYAARFLLSLRDKAGSWEGAVAFYHSATPERGGPYRDRVLASWKPGQPVPEGPVVAAAAPPARPAGPVVIRMVSWAPPPGGGVQVWTPSAPGRGAAVVAMPGRPARG